MSGLSSIIFESRKWVQQESSISLRNPLRQLRPGEHEATEFGSLTGVGHRSRLSSFSQAPHLRFHKKWISAIPIMPIVQKFRGPSHCLFSIRAVTI